MRIKKITKEPKEEFKEEINEVEKPKIEETKGDPEFYIFRTTDTLEKVAEKFETTVDKLKELNDNREISTSNQMRVR